MTLIGLFTLPLVCAGRCVPVPNPGGVFGSNNGGQSGYSLNVIAYFAAPIGVLASNDRLH